MRLLGTEGHLTTTDDINVGDVLETVDTDVIATDMGMVDYETGLLVTVASINRQFLSVRLANGSLATGCGPWRFRAVRDLQDEKDVPTDMTEWAERWV